MLQPPARNTHIVCAPNIQPPPRHLGRRVLVRARLDQKLHHLLMPLPRSHVQRRASILPRTPLRQQPTPAPHPVHRQSAPLWVQTAILKKPSPRWGLEGCPFLGGKWGGIAAMWAIRCAHLSQTRPGACLLLEKAKSRTGTPDVQPCLVCLWQGVCCGCAGRPKNKTKESTIIEPFTGRAPR